MPITTRGPESEIARDTAVSTDKTVKTSSQSSTARMRLRFVQFRSRRHAA